MIGNALLAATAIVLALLFFLMDQLRFLIPWRDTIVHDYLPGIALYCGLLMINVIAAVVFVQRKLFLKDAGRKLVHFDKQLHTGQHALSLEFSEITAQEEE